MPERSLCTLAVAERRKPKELVIPLLLKPTWKLLLLLIQVLLPPPIQVLLPLLILLLLLLPLPINQNRLLLKPRFGGVFF